MFTLLLVCQSLALVPPKKAEAFDLIKTETPYLTDQFQYTFVGTRTGASTASAWAVFKHLGMDGFKKIVSKSMKLTRVLADGLKDSGFNLVVEPTLNIVAFRSNGGAKQLVEKLWRQGWFVSYVPRYDCVRIVVMPHVKRKNVAAFLKDLVEIEKL